MCSWGRKHPRMFANFDAFTVRISYWPWFSFISTSQKFHNTLKLLLATVKWLTATVRIHVVVTMSCSLQSIVHSRPLKTLASVIVWMYRHTTTLQRNSIYTTVVSYLQTAIIQSQLAAVCNISHWILSSSWMRWYEMWHHHPRRFQYTIRKRRRRARSSPSCYSVRREPKAEYHWRNTQPG